jgi:hypothetical protein
MENVKVKCASIIGIPWARALRHAHTHIYNFLLF